jgi:glyoxylase-like metal-dependent hydrolase (beta-lactamase superfamily II)
VIHVRAFVLGSYPIRGFLAWGDGSREALFVDPGGWDPAIAETLAEHDLRVSAIALTHGHWDHTEGLAQAQGQLGAPVYLHADDLRLVPIPPDVVLEGGETLCCGRVAWQVLHMPGHTAGSVAYHAEDVLFSGDTLFAGAIGGTPTRAAYDQERRMLQTRLLPLGDAVRVFPAHGPATTLGVERRSNPFLR